MQKPLIVIVMIVAFGYFSANAEEAIPITFSGTVDRVVFDGKWTFEYEWKQSSLNTYLYENENKMIVLRSAHQGDFVYILLDAVNDESIDNNMDNATICFDSQNNKNQIPDPDDHCFSVSLGNDTGITLQGGNTTSTTGFNKVINHPEFIAVGGVSDENDRYSGVPHTSYEFKIPTDVIGRNSVYGFYFSIYDAHTEKFYTYPSQILTTNSIAGPNMWGEIYSPDKSLPEFYVAPLVMVLSVSLIILFTKIRKLGII